MRIEVPWSLAAAAISLIWSSNFLMLPGFTRTAAQPASIAAKTYFGWKWMSAMTGICDFCAIAGSASASSAEGQATRTMSQPEAVSSAICWSVALMSEVSVVVIDCTETGRSLPTPTLPDLDLAGGAAGGQHRRRGRGHAEGNRSHGRQSSFEGCTQVTRADQLIEMGATMSAKISTTLTTRMTPAIT